MHEPLTTIPAKTYKPYTLKDVAFLGQRYGISEEMLNVIRVVGSVMPFRANNYITDELIQWDNIPEDPIFQLTFPQLGMLSTEDFQRISSLVKEDASSDLLRQEALKIQETMNPHPAGQMALNVPVDNSRVLSGMQHKYDETVLFFPTQGQTCHAYCTYCFRWAQFAGIDKLRFATSDIDALLDYIKSHPEVTDVLFTGGDPMMMNTKVLRRYLDPLLEQRPGNLRTIRIGTKATVYWPYRFTTDKDADELIGLFSKIVDSGLSVSIMTHVTHPRELETPAARAAFRRILSTGAGIRCQAPVIRHVNDDPDLWADMWRGQISLGAIPYYMFVQRNTGPEAYFKLPLVRAYEIFTQAYQSVSGLCRTVRGPSMSATPGKVLVDGIATINGERVFVLKFLQGRNPEWVNRIFFAKYDEEACWLYDLKPAFGESEFFYEEELRQIQAARTGADNA